MNVGTRALLVSAWFALTLSSAPAEVTRVEIESTEPWLGGRDLGKAGAFEKLQGRVYFEIDPQSVDGPPRCRYRARSAQRQRPRRVLQRFCSGASRAIPPAPATPFCSKFPTAASPRPTARFFSAAPGSQFDLMNLAADESQPTLFVFEQGFTVAGWAGSSIFPEAPYGSKRPPRMSNGLVRQSAIATSAGSHLWRLGGANGYCAADAAQPDAQLLVKSHFDDPGRALPRTGWAFAHTETANGFLIPAPSFYRKASSRANSTS